MPIQDHFSVPSSLQELPIPHDTSYKLFICFISSTDPSTKQPWCPDVRAALPRLEKMFFGKDALDLVYVHVGQKPEWKDPNNEYRKFWGINAIPTLVRYQRVDGEVVATGRLVEGEIMDDDKLSEFVNE